jgi:hypothetical protein
MVLPSVYFLLVFQRGYATLLRGGCQADGTFDQIKNLDGCEKTSTPPLARHHPCGAWLLGAPAPAAFYQSTSYIITL